MRTISVDFDGVVHEYSSGWKGARVIPDPPVPGAIDFLVMLTEKYKVAIFSSRSHQLGGRRAMKKWLRENARSHFIDISVGQGKYDAGLFERNKDTPSYRYLLQIGADTYEPWNEVIDYAARVLVKRIKWPTHKPAPHLSIDDRGFCFEGQWPSLETINNFRPWNKKG